MADDTKTTTDGSGASDPNINGPDIIPADSVEPAMPVVRASSVPSVQKGKPGAPLAAVPDDETEFERIERLKLDTADAPHSGVINDDIAKILKEVKLPERRDPRGTAEPRAAAAPSAGTMTMPKTPEEKEAQEKQPDAAQAKPKEREIVTALHTLKDDVQDIVFTRKVSLVRASALEQDKKRAAPIQSMTTPGASQRRRRTFGFVFAFFLLIALGGAALYGVAVVTQDRAAAPAAQYPSIIFAEQTETLPIDGSTPSSLKATIAQARSQSSAPLGSITRIIPTVSTTTASGAVSTEPATLAQFFSALGVQAPDELLRGLGSTFFFGIHTVDINAPVFVIPVTSYDLAFAGMLAWEPTMDQDLAPAFDAVPTLTTDSNGLPVARTFTDAVMLNYDVRELTDDSGNVVLYYSFPTPDILVIAESPHTFTEVLSRLEAQREL